MRGEIDTDLWMAAPPAFDCEPHTPDRLGSPVEGSGACRLPRTFTTEESTEGSI